MRRTLGALVFLAAGCALAATPDAGKAPVRPTLAIVYFDYDKTDELEVLKKGLAQMLITDLGGHPSVVLVERSKIQVAFDELKLTETKKVDPASALKLGKILNAQYVLFGGYFSLFGKLQINTRLMRTEAGTLISGPGVNGKPDDFFALEAELAQKLSSLISTEVPADAARAAAEVPKRPAHGSVAVALKYSKALDAIDRKDPAAARKELEAVVKEQPDFVLATLDLAQLVK